MWSHRITYVQLWIGLALFYVYCRSYLPLMVMLITAVMTAASIAAAYVSARKVTVSLVDIACTADPDSRELEYCCEIKNSSLLPAPIVTFFVNVRDMSESGAFLRRIKTAIEGRADRRVYVSLTAPYAAYCEGNIAKPRVYDAFGLVGFHAGTAADSVRLLMLPNPRPERDDIDTPTAQADESDRYFEDRRGSDRSQVFVIREYRDGDDIRSVHWGLSTKHDALFVKEYSLPMSNDCCVLLESSLMSDSTENTKKSADGVLGEFVSLANSLLKKEIPFHAYILTDNGALTSTEVSRAEDVAQVMMMYLSAPLPSGAHCSLTAMETAPRAEKTVYYIYDSSADGCRDIPRLSENFILIDSAHREGENVAP